MWVGCKVRLLLVFVHHFVVSFHRALVLALGLGAGPVAVGAAVILMGGTLAFGHGGLVERLGGLVDGFVHSFDGALDLREVFVLVDFLELFQGRFDRGLGIADLLARF